MKRSFLGVALALLVSSCQVSRWEQVDVVHREGRLLVETERWSGEVEAEKSGYAHPIALDAQSLSRVLSELRYRATRRAEPKGVVVHPELAGKLAQAIADGLAGAASDARVRFAVLNPDDMLFLPASNLTRGVAFVKPSGVLHFAFDVVDDSGEEFDFGRWGNPVKRVLSSVYVVPGPGAQPHVIDGEARRTWVTSSVVEAGSASVAQAPDAPAPQGPVPVDPDPVDPPIRPTGVAPVAVSASATEVRRIRLELLDELHREGLIGERAYQEKRREIGGR